MGKRSRAKLKRGRRPKQQPAAPESMAAQLRALAVAASQSPVVARPHPGLQCRLPGGKTETPPRLHEDGAVMEKKTRLGRGLDALLGGIEPGGDGAIAAAQPEVPIGLIDHNPYQPRKTFDEDEIASMADSIRSNGVLQPLIVRKLGERYQLIA